MVEGYCVKCKGKKEMKDPGMHKTAKGGFMAKGACPSCGTTMCRIYGKEKAEASMKSGETKKKF